MADDSQRQKGRDGALSLDVATDGLNLAKDLKHHTSEGGLGSVAVLLTTSRVSFLLFYDGMLQAHTLPGLDG